jgi:hypothetical protein
MSFEQPNQPKKNLSNLIKSIALSVAMAAGLNNAKAQTGTQMPIQPEKPTSAAPINLPVTLPTLTPKEPQESTEQPRRRAVTSFEDQEDEEVLTDPDGYEKEPMQEKIETPPNIVDELTKAAINEFKKQTSTEPDEAMIKLIREQVILNLKNPEASTTQGPIS